MLDDTGLKE